MLLPVALLLAVSISISSARPLDGGPLAGGDIPPWDSPHMRIYEFLNVNAGPRGDANPLVPFSLPGLTAGTVTFNFENSSFGQEGWCDFHMEVPGQIAIAAPGWTPGLDGHSISNTFGGASCIPFGQTLTVNVTLTNPSRAQTGNFFVRVRATRCSRSSPCFPTPTPPP